MTSPPHLAAVTTSVTFVTGGFAAMDEIAVEGGELRLAVPKLATFDGVERQVIGFPLRHTAVKTTVGGMMAVHEIEQTFENPFDEPIEAVYVFPLGEDGAVSGYELVIGERTIVGEIQTKENARQMYETAKARGHTAGVVEQDKPNIFTQRIANLAPRETIKTRLRYVELLDHDNGAYTIAVPLTIGPRYMPAGTPGKAPGPYVDDTQASSTVSFHADIDAGVPIVNVESPSHDIAVNPVSPNEHQVALGRADEIPNRDIVVRYKTAGPSTTAGLLAHRTGNDDGFFALAVQPKAQYRAGDIRPREVVIVIDRSGSMDGVPLQQAKAIASGIIDTLSDRDAFNIVAFASGVESMTPYAVRGDDSGKRQGLAYLKAMQSGGGTEMAAGVQQMLQSTPGNDRIRIVYMLSDGFVGNDDVVVSSAKQMLGTNRIFTVGIGSSPNRSLLDKLAATGRGFSSYLTLTESPEALARNLVLKSAYPYLTDISIDWGHLKVVDATPAIVPDVYAGQPLVITGRYRAAGAGIVKISATTAGQRVTIPISVTLPAREDAPAVAALWARRKMDALEQAKLRQEDVAGEIRQLGLAFSLVTDYTSFIAIDRTRVVSNGQTRIVEQPLIVPEGVNPATTVAQTPPPPQRTYSTPSRSYDTDDSVDWGGGGWGSGGAESIALLFALLLGASWLVVRRAV